MQKEQSGCKLAKNYAIICWQAMEREDRNNVAPAGERNVEAKRAIRFRRSSGLSAGTRWNAAFTISFNDDAI